jgi:hypothetical protein
MRLNVAYIKFRTEKHLADTFHIHNGLKEIDASLAFLLNYSLEYAIRKAQANQEECKLSGTDKRLVCTDDISLFGESMRSVEENTQSLLVASREVCLEVKGYIHTL